MIKFTRQDLAGLLPMFFSEADPRPAAEQLNENYAHGGGFSPFAGFRLTRPTPTAYVHMLTYPGDPPMLEVSRAQLRDEMLVLFEAEWLALIQPNGDFVVTRVD